MLKKLTLIPKNNPLIFVRRSLGCFSLS